MIDPMLKTTIEMEGQRQAQTSLALHRPRITAES